MKPGCTPPVNVLHKHVGVKHNERLFEAGRLLTFPTCRVGTYLRWVLILDWALNKYGMSFLENDAKVSKENTTGVHLEATWKK